MTTWTSTLTGGSSPNSHRIELTMTQNSQNVANNTSNVTFTLGLKHVSGSPGSFSGSGNSWSTNFNGTADSNGSMAYDFRANLYGVQVLDTWTTDITHAADGTKSITASGSFSAGGGNIGSASIGTQTLTLTTIPRATTPNITGGTALTVANSSPPSYTINLPRASGSFTHNLTYSFGALSGQTSGIGTPTGAGTSTTFVPPVALLAQIPNAASGTGTLTVVTKNGSTTIGTKTLSFTITGNSTTYPSWTGISVAEATTTPNVATLIGKFVKGVSKITGTITGGVGFQGSTLTEKKFTVGTAVTTFSPVSATSATTSSAVSVSGTGYSIPFSMTDSRGRAATGNVTADILAYSLPSLSGVSIQRATSAGVASPTGTYILVGLTASATSLLNTAVEKNRLTVKVYTSPRGAGTWTLRATPVSASATLTYSTPFYFDQGGSPFDVSLSYDVKVEISDILTTAVTLPATVVTGTISTGSIFQHWSTGLGVGKYWQQGMLDVQGDVYVSGNIYTAGGVLNPTGVINLWTTNTAPTGWLLCDGATISRTTYAALFAAIGTLYGIGDGSTTFAIPNLKGRVPVGRDSSDTDFDTLNEKAGEQTHVLLATEMPVHTHVQNSHIHAGGGNKNFITDGTGTGAGINTTGAGYIVQANTAATTAVNQNAGGGLAHNNLQPYIVLNYIIKI